MSPKISSAVFTASAKVSSAIWRLGVYKALSSWYITRSSDVSMYIASSRAVRPSVARRITYARVGQPINCALSGRVAVLPWWGADVSISTDRREPIGILDGWLCTYGRTAAMFMRIIMWFFLNCDICDVQKNKNTRFLNYDFMASINFVNEVRNITMSYYNRTFAKSRKTL